MTNHDERHVHDTFDRLRQDAESVDTLHALQRVQAPNGPMVNKTVLAMAAVALVLVAAVVGGLLLSGGDDESTVIAHDPDTVSQPDDPAIGGLSELVASSWFLVGGTDRNGEVPLVDGWPITLSFDEETLGGTAACNGYGGSYTLDGGSLTVRELSWTEMGCETSVMASEASFLQALLLVEFAEIVDEELHLDGDGVSLIFAREAPVPTADLINTLWMLDTLIEGDTASSVQGDPATLLLDADGNVSGSTGCRTFTGSYIVTGGSVMFPSFAAQGECPTQLARQDGQVITVLADGFTAEVDGDRLTLTSAGNEGLSYRRSTEAPAVDEPTEPIVATDLSTLLDTHPDGVIEVSAHLVDTGGGWYLCEQIDLSSFTRCASRWIPIVHLDPDIVSSFGPVEFSDDVGSWRQSEEPVLLSGRLLDDGRFALEGSGVSGEATDDDVELVSRFLELNSSDPDVASLPLSPDGVVMGLGNVVVREHTAAELADPANWGFDSEGFRGRTGTFSALAVLSAATETETIVGTHNHCASPPTPVPEALRGARRLSVQPTGIDSCIEWWTVDVFLDSGGDVVGIVFDTWEP